MKWEIFSGLIVCSMLDLWRYQVHWPDKIHCRPSKVITVFVWVSRLENPPSTLFSSSIEFSTMELILLYSASIAMSQCTVLMHLCVHKVYSTHCPPLWLKPRGFVNLLKRQKISRKLQMAGKTETEVYNLWAELNQNAECIESNFYFKEKYYILNNRNSRFNFNDKQFFLCL